MVFPAAIWYPYITRGWRRWRIGAAWIGIRATRIGAGATRIRVRAAGLLAAVCLWFSYFNFTGGFCARFHFKGDGGNAFLLSSHFSM